MGKDSGMLLEERKTSATTTTVIVRPKNYCLVCGVHIKKDSRVTWKAYGNRKYCGHGCEAKVRSAKGGKGKTDEVALDNPAEFAISNYIEVMTRNGRLMADFNLGVLKAVERIKDNAAGDDVKRDGKGIICLYKGVPVTGDMANKAADWLMNNWKGKPGQRSGEVVKKEMTREEIMAGIKSLEYERG